MHWKVMLKTAEGARRILDNGDERGRTIAIRMVVKGMSLRYHSRLIHLCSTLTIRIGK